MHMLWATLLAATSGIDSVPPSPAYPDDPEPDFRRTPTNPVGHKINHHEGAYHHKDADDPKYQAAQNKRAARAAKRLKGSK